MANNDKKKISTKAKVLNFLSFGYLKRKAQNQTGNNNDINIKKNFDINTLYSLLNGKQNLVDIKIVSGSSIKLILKDANNLNTDSIKSFCDAIGIMKSNNSVTIITKSAKYLYEIIEDDIKQQPNKD